MRNAKDNKDFPYDLETVCYIGVDNAGNVMQIDHSFDSISSAYHAAIEKKMKIIAVWPGKFRSDLFEVDDLDAFADTFGVRSVSNHEHKIVWSLNPFDDGKSQYADVDVVLECGCTVNFHSLKKFSSDMEAQKGWNISTSTDISHHTNGICTFRVRRSSLYHRPNQTV